MKNILLPALCIPIEGVPHGVTELAKEMFGQLYGKADFRFVPGGLAILVYPLAEKNQAFEQFEQWLRDKAILYEVVQSR